MYPNLVRIYCIRFPDPAEDICKQDLPLQDQGIFEYLCDLWIWAFISVYAAYHDSAEESSVILVTCCGIQQLYFCIRNGISGAEGEIHKEENDGTAGDPYRNPGIFPLRDSYREEENRCYYP